jgi:Uma2 family endonuclease
MATETTPRKFSVEEFYKLAEVGVLSEDDRVELLDGQIMVMSPIGESHRTVVDSLAEVLTDQRKGRYRVAVQNPLRIDGEDEPQPDLVLYHRSVIGRHPKPSETLLVIEVADASLDYDQRTKIPIYASADIQESWVIDLIRHCIHVYREPNPSGRYYEMTTSFNRSDFVSPLAFPDIRIRLDDLLP